MTKKPPGGRPGGWVASEAGPAATSAAAVGQLVVAAGRGHEPRQPPRDAEESDREHREPVSPQACPPGGMEPDPRRASITAAAAEAPPPPPKTPPPPPEAPAPAEVATATEVAATA